MILRLLHALYRFIVILVTCTVVVPVTMGGVVLASFIFLPLPAALPTPRANLSSQISHVYDARGNELTLIGQPEQIEKQSSAARSLARPNATRDIVNLIEEAANVQEYRPRANS